MKWLTLTVIAWLSCFSVATASLSPPRKSPLFGKEASSTLAAKIPPLLVKQVATQGGEPEFAVTAQTEVLLDGKPCAYSDVPANASILRMDVATDRKTIVTIHFRTRK